MSVEPVRGYRTGQHLLLCRRFASIKSFDLRFQAPTSRSDLQKFIHMLRCDTRRSSVPLEIASSHSLTSYSNRSTFAIIIATDQFINISFIYHSNWNLKTPIKSLFIQKSKSVFERLWSHKIEFLKMADKKKCWLSAVMPSHYWTGRVIWWGENL